MQRKLFVFKISNRDKFQEVYFTDNVVSWLESIKMGSCFYRLDICFKISNKKITNYFTIFSEKVKRISENRGVRKMNFRNTSCKKNWNKFQKQNVFQKCLKLISEREHWFPSTKNDFYLIPLLLMIWFFCF